MNPHADILMMMTAKPDAINYHTCYPFSPSVHNNQSKIGLHQIFVFFYWGTQLGVNHKMTQLDQERKKEKRKKELIVEVTQVLHN